jgi:hypothetical protein
VHFSRADRARRAPSTAATGRLAAPLALERGAQPRRERAQLRDLLGRAPRRVGAVWQRLRQREAAGQALTPFQAAAWRAGLRLREPEARP